MGYEYGSTRYGTPYRASRAAGERTAEGGQPHKKTKHQTPTWQK